jgi:hypothetical protein
MMTAPTIDAVHKNPASVTGLSTQILTAMLMACNTVSTTLMTALLTSGSVRAETTIDNPQRLLRAAEVAEMLGIEPVSSSASPSRKSAKAEFYFDLMHRFRAHRDHADPFALCRSLLRALRGTFALKRFLIALQSVTSSRVVRTRITSDRTTAFEGRRRHSFKESAF